MRNAMGVAAATAVMVGSVAIQGVAAAPGARTSAACTVAGTLVGQVTDRAGAPLDGVHVRIVDRSTGAASAVLTQPNGSYEVAGLVLGHTYIVTVRRIGFTPVAHLAVMGVPADDAQPCTNFVMRRIGWDKLARASNLSQGGVPVSGTP